MNGVTFGFMGDLDALGRLHRSIRADRFDPADPHGQALLAKLAEVELLLYLTNDVEYPFNRGTAAIARTLDQLIKQTDARINAPVDVPKDNGDPDAHDAAVTAQIEAREYAQQWLEQARITATMFVMHLGRALDALGTPNQS